MQAFPIIILSGPTASGKTELAVKIAKEIDAEIISADSRQIYKHMEICTATPTIEERANIPHHFLSIFEPDKDYSAGEYAADARESIKQIRNTGKNIVICGGSGMYIEAIFGMIYQGGAISPELRNKVIAEGENIGWHEMHRRLKELDPTYCEKISTNDIKRISRGWEIYYNNGDIPSRIWKDHATKYDSPRIHIGLTPERQFLLSRINKRVDKMIKDGLIDESRTLFKNWSHQLNALNTLGYNELFAYFNDTYSLEEAIEWIKIHTRQFAKRQSTWFRRYPPNQNLAYSNNSGYDQLFQKVLKTISSEIK